MTSAKYVNIASRLKREGMSIEDHTATPAKRSALIVYLKSIKKMEAAIARLDKLAPIA